MGEQLTDIEINVAQSLLKKQLPKLNGLAYTLYQEKSELSKALVDNLPYFHAQNYQKFLKLAWCCYTFQILLKIVIQGIYDLFYP